MMFRPMETDLKRQIGRSIARARTSRGLTQEDLAERLGRSVEAISNLERGRSFPSVKTLDALLRHLSISLHELFENESTDDSPRARLKNRARALLGQLSDPFLEIAVEQLSVLAKADPRGSKPR
jgi:transcriptional regulator with XRE-family HTH domain